MRVPSTHERQGRARLSERAADPSQRRDEDIAPYRPSRFMASMHAKKRKKAFHFDVPCGRGRRESGLTLTELMVATAVFTLVLGGVIYVHLFGLRMNEMVKAKLGASDEARRAISKMVGEIRSAGVVRVGNGSLGSFTEKPFGTKQEGNAIQIYPSKGNTNAFTRYFWDANDTRLKRTENGTNAVLVVANAITNAVVFTSEDFAGKVLTNNMNNRVIGLMLEFYQLEYPKTPIGPGHYYDYYRLRSRITRRALE